MTPESALNIFKSKRVSISPGKQVSDLAPRSTGQGAKDESITTVFQVSVSAYSAFFSRSSTSSHGATP